jgi:hypothetical protein
MRNLHGITNGITQGWFWFTMHGRNGRDIDQGRAHLYLIGRGSPPILETDGNRRWYRESWRPWPMPRGMNVHAAMCHDVPTKSRAPMFNEVSTRYHLPRYCENCTRLAQMAGVTPLEAGEVRQQDPWNNIPGRNRYAPGFNPEWYLQPDPVTGL